MVLKLSFSRFPHSDICGLLDICSSPQLFAAYHVLLRLPVPRHPPYALFCLTSFSQMYSVTFDFLTMILIHCFNELISSMNSFHCFFYFWSLFSFSLIWFLISHLGCLNILMFLYLNMQFSWNNLNLYKIWQPPTFPYRLQHSIIGRLRLNLRVRDVDACFP